MTIIIDQGEPLSKFVKLLCHCVLLVVCAQEERCDRTAKISHLRLWRVDRYFQVGLTLTLLCRERTVCATSWRRSRRWKIRAEEEWRENYMLRGWDVKSSNDDDESWKICIERSSALAALIVSLEKIRKSIRHAQVSFISLPFLFCVVFADCI